MNLAEIINREKETALHVENLITDIVCDIATQPSPGVKPLCGNCFTVSLSTVRQNGLIMSADYYSPKAQAKAVDFNLSGAKTATDLVIKLNRAITDKAITINKTKYLLNPTTIGILKKYLEES